jgi:phosphotriesterase-related protein
VTVQTLTGGIAGNELGSTLMHEHIFGLSPEIHWNWPGLPEGWDAERQIDIAVRRLDELAELGIGTIVDMTVLGLGPHVPSVAAVARRTKVHIVAATGIYTYDQLPAYFANKGPGSLFGGPDRMLELFLQDITEGMAGTALRAGMLKCCVDRPGITPGIERLLTAVVQAHLQTGVPITVHTDSSTRRGLDALAALTERGVRPDRIVIGHAGDSADLDYLRRLADSGAWLGMDRFGVQTTPSVDRLRTVVALCEDGYADRMVLSHDAYSFNDRVDPALVEQRHPDYHYCHIPRDVVPNLRRLGVTEAQIHQMLRVNPRTILVGDAAGV